MADVTGSSTFDLGVATTVPLGIRTTDDSAADSRKSTSTRDAVGGNKETPSKSRKRTYSRSGTRFRRYSNRSVIHANASISVTPGSDTLWSLHSGHLSWMNRFASSTKS